MRALIPQKKAGSVLDNYRARWWLRRQKGRKEEKERERGSGETKSTSHTGNTQKEKRNGIKEGGDDEKRKNEVGTGYPSPPSWSTLINLLS